MRILPALLLLTFAFLLVASAPADATTPNCIQGDTLCTTFVSGPGGFCNTTSYDPPVHGMWGSQTVCVPFIRP